MTRQPVMPWIFRGLVLALCVYEATTLYTTATGDTISEILWTATDQHPVLGFLAGLLCGHWFWPRRS